MARRKPSQGTPGEDQDPSACDGEKGNRLGFAIMPGDLAEASGSQSEAYALSLFRRVAETIWLADQSNKAEADEALQAALDALRGLRPRDEAEGMLAAQMVAAHLGAMECMRRAMLPGQTFEGRDQNLKHAVRLMSMYKRQLAALDKHRGKGRQRITVEHVNVHAGGQAVVGDVTTGAAASPFSALTAQQPAALVDESEQVSGGEELKKALEQKAAAVRTGTRT